MSNLTFKESSFSDRTRVNTSWIIGSNGGFNLSWSSSPTASCGYIVDWCTTGQCIVEWLKVPPNETKANIFSGKSYSLPTKRLCIVKCPYVTIHLSCYFFTSETFKNGLRYSLSIYACTQGAPVLLEIREGYVREESKIELFVFSVEDCLLNKCFSTIKCFTHVRFVRNTRRPV